MHPYKHFSPLRVELWLKATKGELYMGQVLGLISTGGDAIFNMFISSLSSPPDFGGNWRTEVIQ